MISARDSIPKNYVQSYKKSFRFQVLSTTAGLMLALGLWILLFGEYLSFGDSEPTSRLNSLWYFLVCGVAWALGEWGLRRAKHWDSIPGGKPGHKHRWYGSHTDWDSREIVVLCQLCGARKGKS